VTARALAAATLLATVIACGGGTPRADAATSAPGTTTAARGAAKATVCYRAQRPPGVGPLRFADATSDLGVRAALRGWYGHATAVGDVNGDGWADIFFGGFADKTPTRSTAPDRLLLGGPAGFRLDSSFSVEPGRTSGAAFADLDGDGDLDLVLSRNVRDHAGGEAPSVVLRNDAGRFTQARVLDAHRGGRSVAVFDYEGDGRLDLFLVEDRFSGGSSVLLHNGGGMRFTDTTTETGLPRDIQGLGVAAADLNADGWPDLFVGDSNRLFVNTGRRSFREARSPTFKWQRFGSEDDPAGVAVGDVNRDGRSDLVIGQHYNSTLDRGTRVAVRLYLNEGAGADGVPRFRDVTEESGLVPLPTKAPHVEIADLDNDGWPDLLTTASAGHGTRPAIFRNLGVTNSVPHFQPPEGTGDKKYWIAGATLDVDHDGDLDVFLVDFDTASSSLVLRNDGRGGRWFALQVGAAGSAGIGTSVEVYRAGALGERSQLVGDGTITASTGFGSGSLPVAFFGIGSESVVDVRVTMTRAAQPILLRRIAADRLVDVAVGAACSK
jgi:enediyne biosynthesis protein E4